METIKDAPFSPRRDCLFSFLLVNMKSIWALFNQENSYGVLYAYSTLSSVYEQFLGVFVIGSRNSASTLVLLCFTRAIPIRCACMHFETLINLRSTTGPCNAWPGQDVREVHEQTSTLAQTCRHVVTQRNERSMWRQNWPRTLITLISVRLFCPSL